MFDFSQSTVLITGAAGGIGRELVRAYIEWGGRVIAVDRDAGALDALESSDRLHRVTLDITDYGATMEAVRHSMVVAGPTDILVNNAGAAAAMTLEELTPEAWEHDLDINLTAAYHCFEAVKASMIERRRGVVVSIGSVNSFGAIGHPAYSAAKAGLISYTKAIAVEYGRFGLRANVIAPGTVRTQAWVDREKRNPQIFDTLKRWYPLRTFPTPQDVSMATGFLTSDAARAITGVVLPVDAGLSAGNGVLAAELTLGEF